MLDRDGFATPILDIIRNIYSDSSTKVKTDKELTTPINITQGIKQGCPLSPILLNFVVEKALAALNSSDDGFCLGETTFKFLAYADVNNPTNWWYIALQNLIYKI